MAKRLVSFLGNTNYDKVKYFYSTDLGKETSVSTSFVCHALASIEKPDEIFVLGTSETETNWKSLSDILSEAGFNNTERKLIPSGSTSSDLWEQFEILKECLRSTEEETPEIILDITHGFRAQPFFAAAVISFIRAIDTKYSKLRVVYGALNKETGEAPIWELTSFVELLDWTNAITAFLRSGQAEGIAQPTESFGRTLRKGWANGGMQGNPPELTSLGQAIKKFGDEFITLRTGSLLLGDNSTARYLHEAIEKTREEVKTHFPPLADVLDRIEEMAKKLRFDEQHLNTPQGQKVLANLADLYLSMGRYMEAASTIREGWITLYANEKSDCPGDKRGFDMYIRDKVSEALWHFSEGKDADTLAGFRNDLEHAGYRSDPRAPDTIFREAKEWSDKFRKATRRGTFLNISNHPVDQWDENQKKAALQLAGKLKDIQFPNVPPNATLAEVEKKAEEIMEKVLVEEDTTIAMVQGDFTLTTILVKKLQEKNIVCVIATTPREVMYEEGGLRTYKFEFVSFRPYPRL